MQGVQLSCIYLWHEALSVRSPSLFNSFEPYIHHIPALPSPPPLAFPPVPFPPSSHSGYLTQGSARLHDVSSAWRLTLDRAPEREEKEKEKGREREGETAVMKGLTAACFLRARHFTPPPILSNDDNFRRDDILTRSQANALPYCRLFSSLLPPHPPLFHPAFPRPASRDLSAKLVRKAVPWHAY